ASYSQELQDFALAYFQLRISSAELSQQILTDDSELSNLDTALAVLKGRVTDYADASVLRENMQTQALDQVQNDVPNSIKVMTVPVGPDNIDGDDLVAMVNGIVRELARRSRDGEAYNSSLMDAIKTVASYTDEIDNLQYLRDYPDGQNASDNLADLKSKSESISDLNESVTSLDQKLKALQASPTPLYKSMDQVKSIVDEFNKLSQDANGVHDIPTEIQDAIQELKDRAWLAHKRNIASALLQTNHGYGSLAAYIEGIQNNDPILPDSSNPSQPAKSAKFLGQSLSDAQLSDLHDFLLPYYEKSLLEKSSVMSGLDAYVATRDPSIQAELREYGLLEAFDRIQQGLQQGFVSPSTVPTDLQSYALAAGFDGFLNAQEDLDAGLAADREVAKFRFLDQTGGGTSWA
ncbi:MAG: hypothetical protein KDK37_18945, partial [Leptospiraceae bacterium]|nr:hypothetical protein [Leptospiraceae bacterium]